MMSLHDVADSVDAAAAAVEYCVEDNSSELMLPSTVVGN